MQPFIYVAGEATETAVALHAQPATEYLAGGTTLIDLMKLHVMTPSRVVDLTALPLRSIVDHGDRIEIGALATNSEMAHHPAIVQQVPMVSQALLAGASVQIRNVATAAGNMLQRTRCQYFRDITARCNKRAPGTGCDAVGGYTRMHAIVGTSDHCLASHPSDLCVALMASAATLTVQGPQGRRAIPIGAFYTLPGERPEVEHVLTDGEMIVSLTLPAPGWFRNSAYVKIRDRSSYAFALTSAAVALDLDGQTVRNVRIALGGIGTIPWRAVAAEQFLQGRVLTRDAIGSAARTITAQARTTPDNAFKVPLTEQTLVRALLQAGRQS